MKGKGKTPGRPQVSSLSNPGWGGGSVAGTAETGKAAGEAGSGERAGVRPGCPEAGSPSETQVETLSTEVGTQVRNVFCEEAQEGGRRLRLVLMRTGPEAMSPEETAMGLEHAEGTQELGCAFRGL